jgi:hypothetical protein
LFFVTGISPLMQHRCVTHLYQITLLNGLTDIRKKTMKNKLWTLIIVSATIVASCKKDISDAVPSPTPTDTTTIPPVVAVDPDVANTIGFFMNDWVAKTFAIPAFKDTAMPSAGSVTINVNPALVITKVPASIFGNNANPYMSQMVTEPLLLNHIKNLHPHIIRYPGGNLSSVFFWNAATGAKPADAPDTLVDANGAKSRSNYWYGKNNENWTLSLDNYYSMLQQTGNQGMITVNYGYARYGTGANPVAQAAHLAADWVRYDNGRTKYWEVGNESNGTWQAGYRIDISKNKNGQPEVVNGQLYGEHYKVFKDSMMKAAQEIGKAIYIGVQLLQEEAASWSTATDKTWNAGVLAKAGSVADYYIIHSYYTPHQENSSAADILTSAVTETKKMIDYMKTTTVNNATTLKPIALTEWNIFAEGSMQQVSHISGMHATLVLGEMLANKYGMAARWDLANGWGNGNDHGMFSNGDEPGVAKWNARPAFYHMYYFQKMIGDRLVTSTVTGSSSLQVYASSYTSGQVGTIIVNRGTTAQNASLAFQNFTPGNRIYWYTLTGGTDNGEFSRKVLVNGIGPAGVAGGPADYATLNAYSSTITNGVRVSIPARSALFMVVEKK